MTTQFLSNPKVQATCVHNTRRWQVAEMMGGSAVELLLKTRWLDRTTQAESSLPAHACYPSLFLQGDEASDFLAELRNAQQRLSTRQVDDLLLDAYTEVVHL